MSQKKTSYPDNFTKVLTSAVTRFEVIDDTGRVYTSWPCKIELSFQDSGKTLKVFVTKE